MLGGFKPVNQINIEKKDFENFGAKDFKKYVSEVVATETEFGKIEGKKAAKEIIDFYLNSIDQNPNYKFFLKKYNQVIFLDKNCFLLYNHSRGSKLFLFAAKF